MDRCMTSGFAAPIIKETERKGRRMHERYSICPIPNGLGKLKTAVMIWIRLDATLQTIQNWKTPRQRDMKFLAWNHDKTNKYLEMKKKYL